MARAPWWLLAVSPLPRQLLPEAACPQLRKWGLVQPFSNCPSCLHPPEGERDTANLWLIQPSTQGCSCCGSWGEE